MLSSQCVNLEKDIQATVFHDDEFRIPRSVSSIQIYHWNSKIFILSLSILINILLNYNEEPTASCRLCSNFKLCAELTKMSIKLSVF